MATKITTRWAAECGVRFLKCLRGKIEGMTDDEEVIRDTIEGAADVDSIMETLIGERQTANALAEARKGVAKSYSEAAKADALRAEKIEGLILEGLQASGQDKWSGVAGTASIRVGGLSVDIIHPELVPLQYTKPVPDTAAIRQVLLDAYSSLTADGVTIVDLKRMAIEAEIEGAVNIDVSKVDSNDLVMAILCHTVPGCRLVRGEKTLAIRLPTRKKEAA